MNLYTNCKEKLNTTWKVMKEVTEDISFERIRKEKLWLVNSYMLKVWITTIEELFIKHWPQNFENRFLADWALLIVEPLIVKLDRQLWLKDVIPKPTLENIWKSGGSSGWICYYQEQWRGEQKRKVDNMWIINNIRDHYTKKRKNNVYITIIILLEEILTTLF